MRPDPIWRTAEAIADGSDVPLQGDGELFDALCIVSAIAAVHRDGAVPSAGERWGPLHLLQKVGQGAFGEVFRAWDPRLEREVALKLLYATPAQVAAADRTFAEARMLARVRHPNVATVYGADVSGGRVGVWMELVDGQTLESRLQGSTSFSAEDVAEIGAQLCSAVVAVHAAGVVHGDIKPSNIMIAADGRVVLTDFGAGIDARDGSAAPLFGTPRWMAPELLEDGSLRPAADIYAIGAVLYRLLTGHPPVNAAGVERARDEHRRGGHAPLAERRPDLPAPFLAAIERALARQPDQRYGSAGAMADALREALPGRRPASPAKFLVLAATLTAFVLTGLLMVRITAPPSRSAEPDTGARAAYLQARYEWNKRTGDGFLAARDLFEKAVALDPEYALAYTGLADTYLLLGEFGVLPASETVPRAEAAARRALALDPEMAPAWTALAYVTHLKGQKEEAKAHYRHAIALDPDYATARHWYALTIASQDPDEAITHITRALELEPFSRPISNDVAMVYFHARRLEEAAEQLRRSVQLFPGFPESHVQLGRVLLEAGRFDEAVERLEEACRMFPEHVPAVKELAIAYGLAGRADAARAVIGKMHEMALRMHVPAWIFGQVHAALGDVDAAAAWLQRGVEQGDPFGLLHLSEASFKPVRQEPRIIEIATEADRRRTAGSAAQD